MRHIQMNLPCIGIHQRIARPQTILVNLGLHFLPLQNQNIQSTPFQKLFPSPVAHTRFFLSRSACSPVQLLGTLLPLSAERALLHFATCFLNRGSFF